MDGRYKGREMNDDCFMNVYTETRINLYRPRSVFIDTDNTIINRTRKEFGDMHHPDNFVCNYEDAADTYA